MSKRLKKSFLAFVTSTVLFMCVSSELITLTYAPISKKVEVVILKDGIYDSADVLNAISRYAESIKLSLGFDCAVVKLPSENNSPQGIDALIESRHLGGTQLFILVGNDLRWPLGVWEEGGRAMPTDGVLCDTDGELTVVDDGLHQPVAYFTAEVTVSYVFPPKFSLSVNEQRNHVIHAFNKFEQYHSGELVYDRKGVICGHFTDSFFRDAADRMASASELLFGKEKTVKKELSTSKVREYLEQAPAFFGVAGHGSPQVVETSSSGDYLSYAALGTTTRAPLLLEIFGCWTAGWNIRYTSEPWSAIEGFLSEAGILENGYNIAMVAGFPESNSEASFSNSVLREMPLHPEATVGELMIGKKRRSKDWILFGDPTLKLDVTGTIPVNQPPEAIIDSISPKPAEKGTTVYFKGHGKDYDGKVVGHSWRSDLDGELATSATFSTSSLSVGTHNIYFKVKDDDGGWSGEVSRQLIIKPGPSVTIISLVDRATVKGTTLISVFATGKDLTFVSFYIDDVFKGYDDAPPYEFNWDTTLRSNGQHEIQAKASYRFPPRTITSNVVTVIVDNPPPTVTIAAPTDGSTVNGICMIEVTATGSDKISTVYFSIDGVRKGYDYSPPFQWNWDTTPHPNGQHEVRAEAYYQDIRKYISSKTITLVVDNTITITSPLDGERVSGTVTINVVAARDKLRYIYFYIDGKWKGYSEKSPGQLSWNTVYSANGMHEIYAIGIYEERPPYVETKSETIIVIVDN